jgi:hypothetical protein
MRLCGGALAFMMALAGLAGAAGASDCDAPCLAHAVSVELLDEVTVPAQAAAANDFGATVEAEITLMPAEAIAFTAAVTAEPVLDVEAGESRAFEDIGVYANALQVSFEGEAVTVSAGKFDATFGLASAELDGLHAGDLAGDYDLDERWGLEASAGFAAAGLAHALTASLFTMDRSVFSDSLFTRRGRTTLADGGAGNTRGISSAAVVLDGCRGGEAEACFREGDLGYRLGFLYQRAGRANEEQEENGSAPHDEWGWLAAGTARFQTGEATVRLLGELALLRHAGGGDADQAVATLAAEIEDGPLTTMLAYAERRSWSSRGTDETERLADLTLAWRLGGEAEEDDASAWSLRAGYSLLAATGGETVHTLSLSLTYTAEGQAELARR